MSLDHVEEMPLDEVEWYINRIETERAREARAIKNANRGRG